jgi:hypothetical protein
MSVNFVYDPKRTYIFPLSAILNKNDKIIRALCDSIKTRGYTFVRLSDHLAKQIDICTKQINAFFIAQNSYKKSFIKPPVFGYFNAKHKESFRLLTGHRLKEQKTPRNFEKVISLSKFSDELMHRICLMCSKYLFPDIKGKAIKHNIPLFIPGQRWGMLDATKYINNGSKTGLNCAEHYDPGLLSIHYRSTQPGLQLKNEHGKWINPPFEKNIAIIWAGDVATKINPEIKHGLHRVMGSKSNVPRLALWYEVCTKEQEHTELVGKIPNKKLEDLEHNTGIPISKSLSPDLLRPKYNRIESNINKFNGFNGFNGFNSFNHYSYIDPFEP